MPKTMDDFGVECKKVIDAGNFTKTKLLDLDPWTRDIIVDFLDRANLRWHVSPPVGPGRVVKIYDKYLTYLITMPYKSFEDQTCDQFYWMIGEDPNNDDHAISPDMASAYLISVEYPGAQVTDIRKDDGSSMTKITLPNGVEIKLQLPKGFLSDKTWNKE